MRRLHASQFQSRNRVSSLFNCGAPIKHAGGGFNLVIEYLLFSDDSEVCRKHIRSRFNLVIEYLLFSTRNYACLHDGDATSASLRFNLVIEYLLFSTENLWQILSLSVHSCLQFQSRNRVSSLFNLKKFQFTQINA